MREVLVQHMFYEPTSPLVLMLDRAIGRANDSQPWRR
jgi:hypothetical protein